MNQQSVNLSREWNKTRVSSCLGIEYPIIQGPLGGLSTQRLTATVSNFGGLGSFGALSMGPSEIKDTIAEIQALTAEPFAINLWVSMEDEGARIPSSDAFARSLAPLVEHIQAWAARYRLTNLTFRSSLRIRCESCSMQRYPPSASSTEFRRKRSSTNAARKESLRLEQRPHRTKPSFLSRRAQTLPSFPRSPACVFLS